MMIKKMTTATLIATMTALTVPDSFVPRTSSAVMSKMIAAAGKLAIPGVMSQWLCCQTCGMFDIEDGVKNEREISGPADADGRRA